VDFIKYSELFHHGIKGMHWGIRRYQNADGSLTAEGKKRNIYRRRHIGADKTEQEVDDIINSMNKKDKERVLAGSNYYLNSDQYSSVAKRSIQRDKNGKAVSFMDLLDDGEELQVCLGTRNGKQYRGKGYASKAAAECMNWVKRNRNKIPHKRIVWGVAVNNIGSVKIAQKNGFKIDPKSYRKDTDEMWVNYVYELK
jgi:RimJ/RimL family protein N-acetyltransferase